MPPEVVPGQESGAFARISTMTEAARLADARNPGGEWSYWDAPGRLNKNLRQLMRFAEKEDKRLSPSDGVYYLVSRCGSVAHVFEDEDGPVLEWVFYAPGEGAETLPSSPEAL